MVTKCANPSCNNSFHYFRGGRLYAFERRDKRTPHVVPRIEHYWLCERCASDMTLFMNGDGQAQLQPLHHAAGAA